MRGGINTSIPIYKMCHAEVLSCFCGHKSDEHHVRLYTYHCKIMHFTLILQERSLYNVVVYNDVTRQPL